MKNPSTPEQTSSLKITKLIPGGQAMSTLPDGRKIFLWNALPGETVTDYQITKKKSHYFEAIATAIEHSSPHRIAPEDPCYLSTSPWQIFDYAYELSAKRALLAEQFRQAGLDDLDIPPVATDGQAFHYRNKMEYSLYFSHDDEEIHLAFHARGSHRKIPVEKSSLEHPAIWSAATKIITDLNNAHADSRQYQSLLLRCNREGQVSGGLYENHQPHPVFANLTDTLLGRPYSYSPGGFFQINLPVYEMALKSIARHITTDQVLDLYSGVGSIGLSVAADRDLTLVECDKSAYGELLKNAQRMFSGESAKNAKTFFENIADLDVSRRIFPTSPTGSSQRDGSAGAPVYDVESIQVVREKTILRSVLAKSEDALDFITPDQTVILDPPRAGCHPALLERLLAVAPPTIIYLSCNPATQARDAAILTEKYQITEVQPFNFFPRTPHLENLLIFRHK